MHIQKNILLAQYTTFGIGGPADFFTIASTTDDIVQAITYAKAQGLTFFVLGSGANILVGDKGFRGLVIKNEAKNISIVDNYLTAESGAVMADLITMTVEKGLSGFEHFAGIPSTVGGALWQNLHFLSPDRSHMVYIGDILKSAVIYTEEGKIEEVTHDYFKFGYDSSILHTRKDIVLSATFTMKQENTSVLKERVQANLDWRLAKHPVDGWKISAGSVFKKIEGYGAGRLIEQVGLRGYRLGGAMISPKHANFIVNTGGATAKDVRSLIDLAQKKVREQLNLHLETEISFVGEF